MSFNSTETGNTAGSALGNPNSAPIATLNNLNYNDTQKVVDADLYAILAGTISESLKPSDLLGKGELKGIVLAIVDTHKSLSDREQLEGDRSTPKDEDESNRTLGSLVSSPYGYVVNIPELCFMLPAVPKINSPNYEQVVKVYRDHGFLFRSSSDKTNNLASVGDIVKVGFKNIDTFSGGYYVERITAYPGEHPGSTGGSTNPREAEKKNKTSPPIPDSKRTDQTFVDKDEYLAKVAIAEEEIKSLDCAGKVSKKFSGSGFARDKAFGGVNWFNNHATIDFFCPIGRCNIKVNENAEDAFYLVRNAMAQDPDIIRYMAESILYIPRARLSHVRKTCSGNKVKNCPPSHPSQDSSGRCYNGKGKQYITTPDWKAGGKNCLKGLGNHGLGVGLDINPTENPYSHNFKTDHPPKLQAIFKMYGFRLGTEFSKPDTMHFDFIGEPEEAQEIWNKCIAANKHEYYEKNWLQAGGPSVIAATDGKNPSPRAQRALLTADREAGLRALGAEEAANQKYQTQAEAQAKNLIKQKNAEDQKALKQKESNQTQSDVYSYTLTKGTKQ